MPRKKIRKKNYPAASGKDAEFIFAKKPKKTEKTDFEPL
jgi:hypothetical protein